MITLPPNTKSQVFVGTAGWTVPKNVKESFPPEGSHLQRYAALLNSVEINSSFYRAHSVDTYMKWAQSVPAFFKFSVKMPKSITHNKRLVDVKDNLDQWCAEILGLGNKLGCILVQFPPSLSFETKIAENFFRLLTARIKVDIACEPRHVTWFTRQPETLLKKYKIMRAAVDPAISATASVPGGHQSSCYFRLHGSPRMYYSKYSKTYIKTLQQRMRSLGGTKKIWYFFDNTASGAAISNAIELSNSLGLSS